MVAARFLASHPLLAGVNAYEMFKWLGESFVSQLPRYSLMRISSAYGPGFTRGFIYRAISPNKARRGYVETAEKRDFIYDDDLSELLWKAAAQHDETNTIFDAASGESIDLQQVQSKQPHVIVVNVGSTYLRVGIMGPQGLLPHNTTQYPGPSKQTYPCDSLSVLQGRQFEMLAREIGTVVARRTDLLLEEVRIALGAMVTHEGIVQDASVLRGEPAQGYNLTKALLERFPGVHLTILNDVSAPAWRYKDEGRFCLVTVSLGLGNKVFNANLHALDRLDLDAGGVGGEMGHVHAISQATACPDEFRASKLDAYVHGDVQGINARHPGMAAKEEGGFALRLLEEADVPYCACGNMADLCSYSSGRAALRRARSLATRQEHYGIAPDDITDGWLQKAMAAGHSLALQVFCADIGLDKFIVVGGFVNQTASNGTYLQALRHRLTHLCHASAFSRWWGEDRIYRLVKAGIDDDNDGLIGMGYFVQHLRSHYYTVEKPVRKKALTVTTRRIPDCSAREILAKVILRHERGLEPVVLGHEGVCRVVEVGKDIRGLEVGETVVLNPNNALNNHDKLGHTRESLFQNITTDTLIEPLNCVVAAQGRIKNRIPRRNVLFVGAGFTGFLFVIVNVKIGAQNVFLTNCSKGRLDYAVSKGIVEPEKAFVADGLASPSSLVDKTTAGKGADIVIICVSLRLGVQAAQDAIAYVNPGGCVYLFAGFRPGDMLALDGKGGGVGARLDAWSVRAGWRTERIHTLYGMCVDVCGHRGSRQEDPATAADLLRRNGLSFGRVVSHIISLDALPESMLTLARDGTIQGVPARRVIIDMEAQHRVVDPIGFEGATSLLGWVYPPTWPEIQVSVEGSLGVSGLGAKRHVIWVGTGGWVFLVDALRDLIPTLDTIALMNSLTEYFDNVGLDYRQCFVWLTDTGDESPIRNNKRGDSVIRSIRLHVSVVPFTVNNCSGINALFCAPHSVVMFLPLIMLLQKDWQAMRHLYQQYLAFRDEVLFGSILCEAYSIASNDFQHTRLDLDESIAQAVSKPVTQPVEQALGSKQVGSNPRVRVAPISKAAVVTGFEQAVVTLQMPAETSAVVKAMLTMDAISVFVSSMAYHWGIGFVTHPKVDLYKRRAAGLMAADGEAEHNVSHPSPIIRDEVTVYLRRNPQTRFVEIFYYGRSTLKCHEVETRMMACLTSETPGVSTEVSKGEECNHTRCQAAVQREDTLYVILVLRDYLRIIEGISAGTIYGNIRLLQAIARATYETLYPRDLFPQIRDVFLKP
ncbi:hypothetical protein F5B21DRAFT_518954 [Xylaria acuta]|nr:hypothetical protein F5B21DRAFT_518954 [Xylaria acuta]